MYRIKKIFFLISLPKKHKKSNDIEVIVGNNCILWLNEKHIEEKLNSTSLSVITRKYCSSYRKHRFQLVNKQKKEWSRMFLSEDLALKVINDCRTINLLEFKTNLGFNLLHVFNYKQQAVLGAIKEAFKGENMLTEYFVLGYKFWSLFFLLQVCNRNWWTWS